MEWLMKELLTLSPSCCPCNDVIVVVFNFLYQLLYFVNIVYNFISLNDKININLNSNNAVSLLNHLPGMWGFVRSMTFTIKIDLQLLMCPLWVYCSPICLLVECSLSLFQYLWMCCSIIFGARGGGGRRHEGGGRQERGGGRRRRETRGGGGRRRRETREGEEEGDKYFNHYVVEWRTTT